MKKLIALLLLLLSVGARAQTVFTEEELLAVVRQHHPLARAASTGISISEADLLARRGAFDPQLQATGARKELEGLTYYDLWQAELKVPVWYGFDVTAGFEELNGARLNPESTRGAVSYVGVSVPLLQGLLFDKRRAALQQARLLVNAASAERRRVLNDLLFDALGTYWTWWEATELATQADSMLALSARRLAMVRTYVALGDRPAIDTVEAATQVQAFVLQRSEATLRQQKAAIELSAYLWMNGQSPVSLPAGIRPQAPRARTAPSSDDLATLLPAHPELQRYRFKLEALRIDRRLKFQSLLPDLDLKYQQLTKGHQISKVTNGSLFASDYRFGLKLSVPLRLSEGRGAWRAAKLKLEQATLEQAAKQVQLWAKLRQYEAEWQQVGGQIRTQQGLLASYESLQRGEETRFRNGESSLFLVNAREQKTWEARQKLLSLQAKAERARAALLWAAGQLP